MLFRYKYHFFMAPNFFNNSVKLFSEFHTHTERGKQTKHEKTDAIVEICVLGLNYIHL